jgi:hypothetical protein
MGKTRFSSKHYSGTSRQYEGQPFVTFWRALLGYAAGATCAALLFIPMIDIAVAIHGGKLIFCDQCTFSRVGLWNSFKLELGAVLMIGIFASVWILPMYACGMILARILRIRRWAYFVAMGIALVAASPHVLSALDMHPGPPGREELNLRFAIGFTPLGVIGGLVCWLVLRATYRKGP